MIMPSLNQVIVSGFIEEDGKLEVLKSGLSMMKFRLYGYTISAKDGKKNREFWLQCVLWGKEANDNQFQVTKDRKVIIRGTLQSGSGKDRNGDIVHYPPNLNVNDIQFLEPSNQPDPIKNAAENQTNNVVDGLPF
jgi:single-stranded DNA-binding protein